MKQTFSSRPILDRKIIERFSSSECVSDVRRLNISGSPLNVKRFIAFNERRHHGKIFAYKVWKIRDLWCIHERFHSAYPSQAKTNNHYDNA